MSTEWIKMRRSLQSHPKVVRILSATRADKFRVIGGLHAVWSVFDEHSVDGALKGYTPDLLDHIVGWEGFSRAMESVGWLTFDGMETLTLPDFTEHNGRSAKRRAEDQKRKRDARNCPQSVRNLSADDADDLGTRKRKEIEKEESKSKSVDASHLEDSAPSAADPLSADGKVCEAVLAAYHEALPKCQRVGVLNPKRRRRILAADKLARQVCQQQGWKWDRAWFWSNYFGECAADPWMRGEVPNPNNPKWRQNLDVLLAEDRFAKIMDGVVSAEGPA